MKLTGLMPLLLFLLLVPAAHSQEKGMPFYQNFPPSEYNAGIQNWGIAEDERGIVYVGNNEGVLIYNGAKWMLLPLPNNGTVRGICQGADGRIYVGGGYEFGYLQPDFTGKPTYRSLLPQLDSLHRPEPAHLIWRLLSVGKAIYVYTDQKLIRWDGKTSKVWLPEGDAFYMAYSAHKQVFVYEKEFGIWAISEEGKSLLPFAESFKGKSVFGMIEYDQSRILIGTRKSGFHIYDPRATSQEQALKPFVLQEGFDLNAARPYSIIALKDGNFAVGTLGSGVIILSKEGKVLQQLTKEKGLQDGVVINLSQLNDRSIWLGLNNGISRVEYGTDIHFFDGKTGLEGAIQDIAWFQDQFLAAGLLGVFRHENGRFVSLPGIEVQCWDFEKVRNPVTGNIELLVAASGNIYVLRVEEDKVVAVPQDAPLSTYQITSSPKDAGKVFVGHASGLAMLHFKNGKWRVKQDYPDFEDEIRTLSFDDKGNLWAAGSRGLGKTYRFSVGDTLKLAGSFGAAEKLPQNVDLRVYHTQKRKRQLIFSYKGLLEWEETSENYSYSNYFNPDYSGGNYGVYAFAEARDHSYWFSVYSNNGGNKEWIEHLIPRENGGFFIDSVSYKRLPFMLFSNIVPQNDRVWLLGSEGIYNVSHRSVAPEPFQVLISKVTVGEDSLLYQGFPSENYLNPLLNYQENELKFEFTSTYFNASDKLWYQYRLEGNDEKWSAWTKEASKAYTNLWEGQYTFMVRAKNVYGVISSTDQFTFEVTPPIYRHPAAFFGYFLLIAGMVTGVVRLNTHRLKQDKERLERIVDDRTKEITSKHAELEQQKEEIITQAEFLKKANEEIMEKNSLLEQQKNEIQRKNKDITDSISYARRIQQAILPKEETIAQQVPESFIFYQPRDIVSGDFYWFGTEEEGMLLSVVDCTGHGVPGAFMSVIGNEGLNEVVYFRKIFSPGKILVELHKKVLRSLKQKESMVSDGMEMGVCFLPKGAQSLAFAGARSSLVYIKDGQVFEQKGDRYPIGGFQLDKERDFTTHQVPLYGKDGKPVSFYLYSDGYQDQFGGKKGRKYMSRRLKNFLLEIHEKPMKEQRTLLQMELAAWMENEEQVDDITVLGFRIS